MATQLRLISLNLIVLTLASFAFVAVRSQLIYDDIAARSGNDGSWQLDSEMPTMVKYINARGPTRYLRASSYVARPSNHRYLNALMPSPLINGGNDARTDEVPWQVSFREQVTVNNPRGKHFCGGAIIDRRWIVTAASCLYRRKESDVDIIIGTNRLSAGGEQFEMERFFIHSDFEPEVPGVNDIAVAKTKERIRFDGNVRNIVPIRLPQEYEDVYGTVTISGFGKTSLEPNERYSNNLMVAQQEIITCPNAIIDERILICAGAPDGTVDACPGDIGGPMIQETSQRGKVLIGIVAQGSCETGGGPSVFVRVDGFMDWISRNI